VGDVLCVGGVLLQHPFALDAGPTPAPEFVFGAASAEDRAANLVTLQHYIDTGQTLPVGTIEVDVTAGPVNVPAGASVTGTGTVIDAYPKLPGAGWLLFESTAMSGTITVSNLTVHGPTTAGETDTTLRDSTVFHWHGAGTLNVSGLTVTGLPGRAVEFSGFGAATIANSALSGYISAVARWEPSGDAAPGSLTVSGSTITGVGSAATSVGIYAHPHIPVTVTNCTFSDFARYGLYQNGNMPAVANALIEDCTFARCGVIQSGSSSTATIRRIAWTEGPTGPGSIIRGNVVVEDSTFAVGPWSSLATDGKSLTFRRCSWTAADAYCNFSTGTNLTIAFEDCTWTNPTLVLVMNDTATGTVTFTGCTITDTALTGDGIRIQGVVTLDQRGLALTTSRPFWNLGPNVTVIPPSDA